MKKRIRDLIDKELENEDLRVSVAIEKAMEKIHEENISSTLNSIFYETINVLKYLSESDKMYDYYIRLLALSLSIDQQYRLHSSFIGTLKAVNMDEMTILKNVFTNRYEFISTYDFEKGRGFYNYKRIRFDYPKEQLESSINFDFYIDHLQDVLKLIRWPIYNQEAIIEQNVQTGSTEYSRLIVTVFGEKFISCFI